MKRTYVFAIVAVLLLVLLVPLVFAERSGRHDLSTQGSTKLEQQETKQGESSRVSTKLDLSSKDQPSSSSGGQASKEEGKKAAGGTESKASGPTSGQASKEEGKKAAGGTESKVSGPTSGGSNNSSSKGASSKNTSSGDTQNGKKVPGIRVGVAVVGKKGELLFGPAEVVVRADSIWGITALGALDATGLRYEMSPRFPDLVVAIADQRNEGQSGWMYKVNDEVPMVPASKRKLQEGDRVIWWYSTSLSSPSPEWSSLKKSG